MKEKDAEDECIHALFFEVQCLRRRLGPLVSEPMIQRNRRASSEVEGQIKWRRTPQCRMLASARPLRVRAQDSKEPTRIESAQNRCTVVRRREHNGNMSWTLQRRACNLSPTACKMRRRLAGHQARDIIVSPFHKLPLGTPNDSSEGGWGWSAPRSSAPAPRTPKTRQESAPSPRQPQDGPRRFQIGQRHI